MSLSKRIRWSHRAGYTHGVSNSSNSRNRKRPTAMLDRNLSYLSLVEVLYGYPLDGVILTTG